MEILHLRLPAAFENGGWQKATADVLRLYGSQALHSINLKMNTEERYLKSTKSLRNVIR